MTINANHACCTGVQLAPSQPCWSVRQAQIGHWLCILLASVTVEVKNSSVCFSIQYRTLLTDNVYACLC